MAVKNFSRFHQCFGKCGMGMDSQSEILDRGGLGVGAGLTAVVIVPD